jgi:glycosyltransferase involved in cell wall biosynthesis
MHLGVDLLFLVPGRTGGRETYARELLPALRLARPQWRVTGFVGRDASGPGWWRDVCDEVVVLGGVSGASRGRWAAGELLTLPRSAAEAGIDLLHSAANFAPVRGPFARVVTIHDVIWRVRPESVALPVRWATTALVAPAGWRANRVIAPSVASRDDVARKLRVRRDKIDVVPNGVVPPPEAGGDGAAGRAFARVPEGRRVALSVASNVPHKDLPALLQALATLPPGRRPVLVFAGAGTQDLAEEAAVLGVIGDVRLLGPVDKDRLEDLYCAANVLATATRHEGFGLPLVEAMARGVPVVCPDLPVLREVAGEAAHYVAPGDLRALGAALAELPEVDRLRAAGIDRAARYTWEAAGAGTAESFERALGR